MGSHLPDAGALGEVGSEGLLLEEGHGEGDGGGVDDDAVADDHVGGGAGADFGGGAEGHGEAVSLGGARDGNPIGLEGEGQGGGAEDIHGDAGELAAGREVEDDRMGGGGAQGLKGIGNADGWNTAASHVAISSSISSSNISRVDLL